MIDLFARLERHDRPQLVVGCEACGKGMSFELGRGRRLRYTGMRSALVLANLFRHFHTAHGTVAQAIFDPLGPAPMPDTPGAE